MSTLTGKTVATTYRNLLQISNNNDGIDDTIRYIEDGEGTPSLLGLSTSGVQIDGHFTPELDSVYDLGSSTRRFRDIYLSGNTIYIGDKSITSVDVQALKDVQTTNVPVSSIAELASTSVQPGDSISYSVLIDNPTTLAGYGIADAVTSAEKQELSDSLDDIHIVVRSNSGDWFSPPELTNLLQTSSGTWNTATQPDTDVQFNNLNVTGGITGPAVMTIDPAAVGDNTGKVIIAGDLQVDGTTTTVNSTSVSVSSTKITLAQGATNTDMVDQSGLHVDLVDANILYNATNDRWDVDRDLNIIGTVDATNDLKVNGDSVVTQSDVGTAPNQIPLNQHLGSLAYQDSTSIKSLTVDVVELDNIDTTINQDAVDVVVYDTSKDSDGGAWRNKTRHTSWYNEPLNTKTRGARKEFPRVAVIVVKTDQVIIYDADSPELYMWMIFNSWGLGGMDKTSGAAMNGKIVIGTIGWGAPHVDFIKDYVEHQNNSSYVSELAGGVINRNTDTRRSSDNDNRPFHNDIYSVDITVLPGAKTDLDTGLPNTAIAAGGNGSLSILHEGTGGLNRIHYTGTGSSRLYKRVKFSGEYVISTLGSAIFDQAQLVIHRVDGYYTHFYRNTNTSSPGLYTGSASRNHLSDLTVDTRTRTVFVGGEHDTTSGNVPKGLKRIALMGQDQESRSLINYTTHDYNTGWIPGDADLVTMCDTTPGAIGSDASTNYFPVKVIDSQADFDTWNTWGDVTYNGGARINFQWADDGAGNRYPSPWDVPYLWREMPDLEHGARYAIRIKATDNNSVERLYIYLRSISADGTTTTFDGESYTLEPIGGVDQSYILNFTYDSNIHKYIYFQIGTGIGDIITLTEISLTRSSELITGGDFSVVDFRGDLQELWTGNTANRSIDLSTSAITFQHSSGDWASTYQAFATTPGTRYTVTADITVNPGIAAVTVGTGPADPNTPGFDTKWNDLGSERNYLNGETGTTVFSFVATSETSYIHLLSHIDSGSTFYQYDNVSVRPAVMDRGLHDNKLMLHGGLSLDPVAPGAQLQGYSGFDVNNYITRPADDSFGSGDFTITGWYKFAGPISDTETIFIKQDPVTEHYIRLVCDQSLGGRMMLQINDVGDLSAEYSVIFSQSDINTTWNHLAITRVDDKINIYINGVSRSAVGNSIGEDDVHDYDLSFDGDLVFGILPGQLTDNDRFRNPWKGGLALWKVSSSTGITQTQIDRLYQDEATLFQHHAQCTLTGQDVQINALDFDHDTNLLHVGTNQSRDVFSGLERVDSIDQPVTTAISVCQDLVAEQ